MSQEIQVLKLQQKLVEAICGAIPECVAVYRFGSWGTEDQRADSDIDLALLTYMPLDPVHRWNVAQNLAALAKNNVDLVDLLQASTVLRKQVVAYGERLYCANLDDVERFEDSVYSSYARLNEERRLILEDVRERGSVYGK